MADSEPSGPDIPEDIAALSFEQALEELEGIVRQLEDGRGKLDEAIDAYTRGELLKRHCEKKLAEAKARVDKISIDADGTPGTEPLDVD